LSMAAATVAVMLTGQTHPVALLLLSAGVLACGLAAYFMHNAMAALIAPKGKPAALSSDRLELLQWDKQRVLHSIKELEFDHRMGKVDLKDFQTLAAPLRLRAATLMEDIDRLEAEAPPSADEVAANECPKCGTANDPDARFCKSCGGKVSHGSQGAKGSTGAVGAMVLCAVLGSAWAIPAAAQTATPDPKTVSVMPIPAVKGTVTLGPNTRIVVEPGDEVLTVYYVLDIVNSGKAPVDLGGPLQLDLPEGARGGGIMDGSSPQGKLLGAHLTVVGPFKPGSTEVQLGFELPTGSATKTITQTFPVAVPATSVVLQRAGIEDLVSPQLADRQETTNQGQPIVMARGAALGPGGTLSFDVTGLPHHPRWPRYLALTLAVGFLFVGIREGFRRA
jgi:Double zinc ribbon